MSGNRRKSYRNVDETLKIPAKANRVLNIILAGMLLIVLRIWHLAIVQYDEKLEEARKPQRRMILEPAKRATIRDRFNEPLAINKVQYNAAVVYSQIKRIPSATWETDHEGKKVKRFKRKEYIVALSQLLAQEFGLDAERIEDLIHAKASFYNDIPFTIKEDISEQSYYRLKVLENDWPGIVVSRLPRRYYTHGKTAADIIGYMGAINQNEYEEIIREIKGLGSYITAYDNGEDPTLPPGIESIAQARKRLKDLHELAYTANDSIGKAGIEGRLEKTLRGYRGKKSHYSDAHGKFLRELPGTREPLSGQRLLLTISIELQEYAEKLLIQNEKVRQTRLSHLDAIKHTILADKDPWIKGGGIVAIDPNNGEILAMASHPRFNPNDFIAAGDDEQRKQKRKNIQKWFENESYLAEIWDQQKFLERDAYDEHKDEEYTETRQLTWDNFLDMVLAVNSPLRTGILSYGTVKDAVNLQKHFNKLLEFSPKKNAHYIFNALYRSDTHQHYGKKFTSAEIEETKRFIEELDKNFPRYKQALESYTKELNSTYSMVLLVDLMRIAVSAERFSDQLIAAVGKQTLYSYRQTNAALVQINETVKKMSRELYHELHFKKWRKDNEKDFLKQKRAEEKAARKYAKPYIEYLDAQESLMFSAFWETYRWDLIMSFLKGQGALYLSQEKSAEILPYTEHFESWYREIIAGAHKETEWIKAYLTLKTATENLDYLLAMEYLKTLRSYHDLNRPLYGKYRHIRKNSDKATLEKHLATAFYPKYGYGYGRSQAYRQAATQGSLFKLVTAYEALVQRYHKLDLNNPSSAELNPLTIVDTVFQRGKDLYVGYDQHGHLLPRHYKGGRLPRSSMSAIGEIDLLKALEMSSNPYFALLAGDILESPLDLAKAAKLFSYGARTGINLPGEITGKVPEDLDVNPTGLYAMSIGQHTLVVTPLQTSVMLSSLANGGKILKPKIVSMMVGREPRRGQDLESDEHNFAFEKMLEMVGIEFPLFIGAADSKQKSLIKRVPTEIHRQIFLPDVIQRMLLDGMCRVVGRTHGESLNSLSRMYHNHPEAISDYIEMKHQLLGKTSTSEVIENIDLDLNTGTNLYTHVWFGGISYDQDVVDKKSHRFLFRDSFGQPELVVVVYLKYGGFGKEAGPIAAQMAKKWKEIKRKQKAKND